MNLDHLTLAKGAHTARDQGVCAMEAVAWLAGEPHSDRPACTCPVIGTFVRRWNDDLRDADRNRLLLPLLPSLVGTRGSAELERRRSFRILDWMIRTYTPAWLDLIPSLTEHAAALRGLAPTVDPASAQAARDPVDAARAAAWAAARAAARGAAWDARAAARAAAWAAARAAAWAAAWAAARAAARAAAGAAAVDAAGAAAVDALAPTVARLQASAAELVAELCAMKESA